MKRLVAISTCAGLIALGLTATASAQPKAGAKCAKSVKVGKTVKQGGVTLKCTKTKKGKVWRRVVTPAPTPGPAPTPTPTPPASGGVGIVPSRTWECAVGAYPYTSYQKLVTSGSSYTVSWTDGTGASNGTIVAGSHAPLNSGTVIKFVGGAWDNQKGEYAPAGTKTTPSLPPLTVDQIYVDGGLNNNYYPVTCSPK